MASPDVARLARRVDHQDETVRAIGDTLLDVKDTVDQHTGMLTAIQATLTQLTAVQAQQGAVLGQHGEMLGQQGAVLGQHGEMLGQHGEMLVEILRRLGPAAP